MRESDQKDSVFRHSGVDCQFCYDIMSIRKQGEADEESNTDRRIRL